MIWAARRTEPQKIYGKLLGPLLVAIGVFYLIFHALSGERGIYALLKEDRKLEILKEELDKTVVERKDLEHRVRLLSSNSLDLDLLDEQSRSVLGQAGEDEVVIPLEVSPAVGKPANKKK